MHRQLRTREAKIVPIGNSKGVRIPKALLNPTIGGEIQKIRPVVTISQDEMNKYLDMVVICPLTSKLHPKWRTRLQIKCVGTGCPIHCHARQTLYRLGVPDIPHLYPDIIFPFPNF